MVPQIHCQSGKVYIDLDLPEIEDLPSTTTKQLKSGQVKVVNKPQKKLKEEYATCVLGLAFFIAGNTFNLNANIKEVEISGYMQRRNRGGDIDDDYIYSVRFPREEFRKNPVNDPLRDFNEFEIRISSVRRSPSGRSSRTMSQYSHSQAVGDSAKFEPDILLGISC